MGHCHAVLKAPWVQNVEVFGNMKIIYLDFCLLFHVFNYTVI